MGAALDLKQGKIVIDGSQADGFLATLIGGDRANPTRLEFVRSGDVLVSTAPLPEGDNLPIIFQLKLAPGAKPAIERFNLNLSTCPECKLKEYACACGH